ncbi:hypothetical protein AVIO78A_046 [Escherichia phage vB_EcoS_AVIO78A]|nr:hypothetical protein AVIO78A_046 [Escherichia phage vB_EcoS_AVIO78A]
MDPNIRVATDEFIRRARKIHGDRYDYSFSIVEDSSSTVVIIDRETNTVFFQVVAEHLDGVEPVTTAVEPVTTAVEPIKNLSEIFSNVINSVYHQCNYSSEMLEFSHVETIRGQSP